MIIQDGLITTSEKIVFALRRLYHEAGYVSYRMSKFEEYDLYANNKDFLVSDNVITFTDTTGRLMALKPDVTLSIIKNTKDAPDTLQKVFYSENVYRVSKGTNSFKEIMQTGLECFGAPSDEDLCEVIRLAAQSLRLFSDKAILTLSDLSLTGHLLELLKVPSDQIASYYHALSERNPHELDALLKALPEERASSAEASLLRDLTGRLSGPLTAVFPALSALAPRLTDQPSVRCFLHVLEKLCASDCADMIAVDFSVVDDTNYYNGIVFKGFLPHLPEAVISGGQYDKLMRRLGRRSRAIGFAVYTDLLERVPLAFLSEGSPVCGAKAAAPAEADDVPYLNVALPKGRLGEKVYSLFAKAGYECPSILEENRKLIFENPEKHVRYFWVKPSDVAIYVERGAADIGVAGKDILLEYEPDLYELLDLGIGTCRMAVAAPNDFADDPSRTLRVATKFSNIASTYYRSKGRDIDIIHLNGSIEIAPILGLSDVIVDIVETGRTLVENDLSVIETVVPISARLIANKSSYKFHSEQIQKVAENLAALVKA